METGEITFNPDEINLEDNAMAEGDAGTNFCSVWPTAKLGLDALKGLIKSPIAKVSISVVIAAGDAVSTKVCS